MASVDVGTLPCYTNASNIDLVMSVLASLRYCLGNQYVLTDLWLAYAFMPFGLLFDLFDGKVARWRKKSSLMGQELDSLADLVCPTVPAV